MRRVTDFKDIYEVKEFIKNKIKIKGLKYTTIADDLKEFSSGSISNFLNCDNYSSLNIAIKILNYLGYYVIFNNGLISICGEDPYILGMNEGIKAAREDVISYIICNGVTEAYRVYKYCSEVDDGKDD